MFFSERSESVHVRSETCALGCSQTCAQISLRYDWLWTFRYTSVGGVKLFGYTDSDWAGSVLDRKSTSGYCFSVVSAMISWSSKKQNSMALSTAEAEYIAANDVGKEAIWLRKLLVGLFGDVLETTVIQCDNQSCVKLSENFVFHDRLKHIEMQYHYL